MLIEASLFLFRCASTSLTCSPEFFFFLALPALVRCCVGDDLTGILLVPQAMA